MKRLKPDGSSSSDSDDISLSRIKSQHKKTKTSASRKSSSKEVKKKIEDDKQPKIDLLMKNLPQKRKGTIDNYFVKKDTKDVKAEVGPENFFSGKKVSIKNVTKKANIDDDDLFADIDFDEEESLQTETKKSVIRNTPEKVSTATSKSLIKSPNRKQNSMMVSDVLPKTPEKNASNSTGAPKLEPNVKSPSASFNSKLKSDNTLVKTPEKTAGNSDTNTPKSASKFNYHAYMNRPKPAAIGSKEIPEGSPNCLAGLTFVITGVLDSIERDDAQSLIERHGGRVTKAVSGKTSYLVVGNEPGESKVNKVKQQKKTKIINEDELFDLIRKSSPVKVESAIPSDTDGETPIKKVKKESESIKIKDNNNRNSVTKKVNSNGNNLESKHLSGQPVINKKMDSSSSLQNVKIGDSLFVEKYRPKTMKQLIGQHGDRSPANKLYAWLSNWYTYYKNDFKSNDESQKFRAALLSGPPGIGKTTTAHVVAKQLGFEVVEFNASSTRSKSQLIEVLPNALSHKSFRNNVTNICVVMDEVDGMAGNADRGGISELIQMIKISKNPIICICNDRQSQKIRSLVNYTYDLPFRKLTLMQVKGALKSVLDKENIKNVPDESLEQIIVSSNYDLRQVLNNMQMWSAGKLDSVTLKSDAQGAHKDVHLKIFDICAKVFSHENLRTYTDKIDLFFEDYQLEGLFVQENYPSVRPYKAKGDSLKTLKLMSLAADSISMSDICSTQMRSTNDWSILPHVGMLASVIPGEYLHGRLSAMVRFPKWLGSYSSTNKNYRLLSNLSYHLRLSTKSGISNAHNLLLDYGSPLIRQIIRPLKEGDLETTIRILESLQLIREDLEQLSEVVCWSWKSGDPIKAIGSQIKSGLTREYKKASIKLPYAIMDMKKGGGRKGVGALLEPEKNEEGEVEVQSEPEEDDKVENDSMIIANKKTSKSSKANTGSKKKLNSSDETSKKGGGRKKK